MKKLGIAIAVLAAMVGMTACGGGQTSSTEPTETAAEVEVTTEAETEAETEPPTNAAFPEPDANALTFDEDGIGPDLGVIIEDDDASVGGKLEIVDVDGNKMLRFTDETTTEDNINDAVQKLRLDVTKLLAPEQLTLVNCGEFDLYAQAKGNVFVNDLGESPKVPGWIGGGGGSEMADGKWFGFSDFSSSGQQEYDLERSDALHVSFRFIMASGGKKWEADMTEPYLQIMRWGMQNIQDTYIDNITFFDADGNSIPLTISDGWAAAAPADEEDAPAEDEAPAEDAAAAEDTAAEDDAAGEDAADDAAPADESTKEATDAE